MCKNHRNVAITISICIIFSVIIFVIAISNFFTNENIEKYTTVKSTVACKYTQKILEEPIKEETIAKVEKTSVTVNQKNTTEKTNSSSTQTKNTNQNTTVNKQQTQVNESAKVAPQPSSQVSTQTTTEQSAVPSQYKGLSTIGKIEIPRTGVNMPILSKVTAQGMEIAPCLLYSSGKLNVDGNNLIVGHNYNSIFSKNKNLQIGDKIYITTLDGKRLEYTVYNKFLASPEETSYIKRNTNNQPEITLSTCTEDDNYRMIILAKI